jgi:hypothetical protein
VALASGTRVLLVTPLRTLSAQTERSFRKTFSTLGFTVSSLCGASGLAGGDEDAPRSQDIVISTPEKLDFALRNAVFPGLLPLALPSYLPYSLPSTHGNYHFHRSRCVFSRIILCRRPAAPDRGRTAAPLAFSLNLGSDLVDAVQGRIGTGTSMSDKSDKRNANNQAMVARRAKFRFAPLVLSIFWGNGLTAPATAADETTIDLTYDSVMDMVRPEVHPGIAVHHNLKIVLSGNNKVSESRNRNTKSYSDSNSAMQVLSSSGDDTSYSTWRVSPGNRLIRLQHDPQSTRTMTVTLVSGNSCHLEVVDHLKPGFQEYAFLRISVHALGYFTNYHVTSTSCSIH